MNPIHFLSHDVMLPVLNFFYVICKNYGVAIIFLTIAIKILLYPLTLQSTRQMKAMQDLQPKLKDVQDKFKGKPDQLQRETLELYRKHKVNPLGGCLPMLLQIPFFIALFVALTSPEFGKLLALAGNSAGTFLWIRDITKPDPTLLMSVLIGLSTYLTQKVMSTPTGTATQQQMMVIMPFFIAFISYSFGAGVQIYWVVSNLLTAIQQSLAMKKGTT